MVLVTAIRSSLSLKVSLILTGVIIVLTSIAGYTITARQVQAMQEMTIVKARLAAALGAQTYGAIL